MTVIQAGKGTGLLECSRRFDLSLNTVKRYARAAEPERMIRGAVPAENQAEPSRPTSALGAADR
jgi:hypothetical protein